jgi:indolepyruvate ferredoxin oxidoreductase
MTDTAAPAPAAREFTLGDRYTTVSGEILATGVQALARLPMDQMRADRRAGLDTAAFISGYQGSPLGGYDRELQSQRALLDELRIVHRPALNEELGATAVTGSQLAQTFASHRYDGVLGIWYGKSPGVDRAGDAIRHGNFAGTSRHGGVLALTGDDPACKSSTLPSRSEVTLGALGVAVLYPGTVQDVLDLGLHGVALSRASGLWVAIKVVTAVADGSGTALVDPDRIRPVVPSLEVDGRAWTPTLTGNVMTPSLEAEVLGPRTEMALRYILENGLNRIVVDAPRPWLGIVAGGHVCEQVMEALATLGLDEGALEDAGVRVLKLGALSPFDGQSVRRLAAGTSTVLVVEDKTPNVETLVRDALYGVADRPRVLGKRDAEDRPLIPLTGALTAAGLVEPLRRVLTMVLPPERLAPSRTAAKPSFHLSPEAVRTPFFCSGCPHNTGTLVPDGSLVGAGIGCHGMVSFLGGGSRGTITGITQMGGEGSQWIGIAPFVADPHLFQNVGDGTFFHSGQLSVQAAVAADVDITFKLLYNSAVAMTGGQDATGLLPVPAVASKLLSEGVKEVVITTDEPGKYRGVPLPKGATVRHRDDIIKAQEHLRTIPGVTVLIHDQQCAAEKRRDRKRGLLPRPTFKIMIDERVCEGCGDCGVKSNCLSLQPIDTEFGRKTTIDQASCNLDVSCIKGDCPAFVTVTLAKGGSRGGRPGGVLDGTEAPEPTPIIPAAGATLRMPGIGGTGVVTVSQMLAAAARMEEIPTHSVDQTGLSQKAGPVVSTISIGAPEPGRIDVLLGFDVLTSVTPANLQGLDPEASVVVASTTITPTGRMVGRVATAPLDPRPLVAELDSRSRRGANTYVDASRLTAGLLGDAVTANVFLLGVAYQAGVIPVTAASIERAIDLNGTAVDLNLQAFRWGRLWVVDPDHVERQAGLRPQAEGSTKGLEDFAGDAELQRMLAVRVAELTAYQDRRYARRYLGVVRRCAEAERTAGTDGAFTRTVAHQLHRLMAYKDEYEVARLLLEGGDQVTRTFGEVDKVTWNLHPPVLRAMGLKRKLKLGPWARPALVGLRSMKRVRGTRLDPFGRAEVRRTERQLVVDYVALVDRLLPLLATDPADAARVAGLVDVVRGYEGVKMANVEAYRKMLASQLSS